jgi:hypothetical protein
VDFRLDTTSFSRWKESKDANAAVFKKSLIDSYTSEGVDKNYPAQVRLDESSVSVSYEGGDGIVVYEGNKTEHGYFRLHCLRTGGRATLHLIPEDDILEGSWLQGGEEGMWRIDLLNE